MGSVGQTFGIVLARGRAALKRFARSKTNWLRRGVMVLWFALLVPVLLASALAWLMAAVLAVTWVGVSRLAHAVAARSG